MRLETKLSQVIAEYQHTHQKKDGTVPSHAEIAVLAGVNPATLSRYINGHTESYNREVMTKLAKYLGIKDAGDLFVFLEVEE